MPATELMPSAMPRWLAGNASVRIAAEFAMIMAPPMPWTMRIAMRNTAAGTPPK